VVWTRVARLEGAIEKLGRPGDPSYLNAYCETPESKGVNPTSKKNGPTGR
jgi:hypothetical protein